MKITQKEFDDLMAHFYFLEDKVEACYKRETRVVLRNLEKEYSQYINNEEHYRTKKI